jgi:AraC-like DNA-binding protein
VTRADLAELATLRRAKDFIDREHAQPLDVPTMARRALMSPAHFSRRFKAAYGETPYGYLMTRRIERAMALLRAGMSVTDACMAVGCTSLGSFSARFTELVGEPPSAYRARDHGAVRRMPSCTASSTTRPARRVPSPATTAVTTAVATAETAAAGSSRIGEAPVPTAV